MNCQDAESYMMKYMDGELTKKEAEILHGHITGCPCCKCSFEIYDLMLQEFEKIPLTQAPEAFEMQVMAQITQLSQEKYHVRYSIRNAVWGHIWGAFTIVFGTGTVIALNYDTLVQSLTQYPAFESFISKLTPVKNQISYQTQTMQTVTEDAFYVANQALTNSVGIIFILLTAVCGVQYYLLRRRKNAGKVNRK